MADPTRISFLQSFRLTPRFFICIGSIIFLYVLAFGIRWIESVANFALLLLIVLTLADAMLLGSLRGQLKASREPGKIFSLGDKNLVKLTIENHTRMSLNTELYDELPVQFQQRDFYRHVFLQPGAVETISYSLRPITRGEYHFHMLNSITTTLIGLCARRILLAQPQMVPVLPSVVQMKKYELLAFARISNYEGIKRIRRLGHSYEFEKIRNYMQGDDIRTINWKATGRRNALMVNQYEDERSQQVYMVLDKSRSMHMPFNGLSLLDYSVNTSLVLANIALKKYDKTGLITFANRIGSTLPAERNELQLKKILNQLYREKPQPFEASYELLYRAIKNVVHGRSLLFLYLNFESTYALKRALPILQKINRMHLLVVMIFENTELETYSERKPTYVSDIYAQTIAKKLLNDKKQIVAKLRKYGIQTILSKPEDLSINTVNKYLELKARALI